MAGSPINKSLNWFLACKTGWANGLTKFVNIRSILLQIKSNKYVPKIRKFSHNCQVRPRKKDNAIPIQSHRCIFSGPPSHLVFTKLFRAGVGTFEKNILIGSVDPPKKLDRIGGLSKKIGSDLNFRGPRYRLGKVKKKFITIEITLFLNLKQ